MIPTVNRAVHTHGEHNNADRHVDAHLRGLDDRIPTGAPQDLAAVHDAERLPYVADGSLRSNHPECLLGPDWHQVGSRTAAHPDPQYGAYDPVDQPQHGGSETCPEQRRVAWVHPDSERAE